MQSYANLTKMATMKKFSLPLILSLTVAMVADNAFACTNVLITKGATVDGSNMISYAADSHQLFGELYHLQGGTYGTDAVRQVIDWDSNKPLGSIPQAVRTFTRNGNMNDKGLVIGETTYGGREELYTQDGAILDYGSLIYIALERCSTAREAIRLIYDLTCRYGYCSEGESFSLADRQEVWVMDLIGKGNFGKGIVFVAMKVPDGYICAHANQSRITSFPLDRPDECIYSPDVISFARERGYFSGKDSEFSFADAYNPLDFGGMRGCEARAWSAFNILCDGTFTFTDKSGCEVSAPATDYVEYALGHDRSKRFPLFVKPLRKLSVADVARVMRDHYEGTPMDMTTDIGAGGNRCPYRWRPMTFKVGDKEYYNERAIATQQTGFWFVAQSRPSLPEMIGSVIWFGTDDAATSYLTPIYATSTKVPNCFETGNGDMLTYSPTSAFWMCNRVANACYRAYDMMAPTVQAKALEWENSCLDSLKKWDAQALSLYKRAGEPLAAGKAKRISRGKTPYVEDPYASVREYLTDCCCNAAQNIFGQWTKLEEFLLVKFIDGNVKPQNADGSWITNGYGNIPDHIDWPGYSEKWKKAVADDNGNILQVINPQ